MCCLASSKIVPLLTAFFFQYTAAPAEHAMHDASWQTVLHHGDNLIINEIMDRTNAPRILAQRTLSGSSFNKDSH
eukprot:scaffold2633_cov139-Skeletonema_menzelii.AAC.6